jgi:hypothetical protein
MATESTSGARRAAPRRTPARKPAATGARSTRATSTARTAQPEPKTRVEQAQRLAERAVLVQVGASLVARDNLVSTVSGLATTYATRTGIERELKRYERRGATARNRFERQVRKARTRFERELRQRRSSVERSVKQNRTRLEREVRSVRRDPSGFVSTRVEKLVSGAQERIGSAS